MDSSKHDWGGKGAYYALRVLFDLEPFLDAFGVVEMGLSAAAQAHDVLLAAQLALIKSGSVIQLQLEIFPAY